MRTDREALRAALENLTRDLRDLIEDSAGVSGLHLNGDLARWGELERGGYSEEWLSSLADAEDLLAALAPAEKTPCWCQLCGKDTPTYCDDYYAALAAPPAPEREP